jgi:hypothetical protein
MHEKTIIERLNLSMLVKVTDPYTKVSIEEWNAFVHSEEYRIAKADIEDAAQSLLRQHFELWRLAVADPSSNPPPNHDGEPSSHD